MKMLSTNGRARRLLTLVSMGALACAGLGACGNGNNPDAGDAAADVVVDSGPPVPIVRLAVDSDRNGTPEFTGDDQMHRAEWGTTFGAVFLANIDDDDENHEMDWQDDAVNGDNDALDLARVLVQAFPRAPMDATATLTITGAPDGRIKLFKHVGADWVLFNPAADTLTQPEIVAGVEFGIEATALPSRLWDGQIAIALSMSSAGAELGTDTVTMHVAPFVLANPIAETQRVFAALVPGYLPNTLFIGDLTSYLDQDSTEFRGIDSLLPEYVGTTPAERMGPDVWSQDIMEFGYATMPAPGGARQSMHIVWRSPQYRRPATLFCLNELLGPDFGYVWPRSAIELRGGTFDGSLDSFGNTEVVPPYRNGDMNYPLGRGVHGRTAARHGDPATEAFMEAQVVQGPPIYVDTSWLLVGHVDEVFNFVPVPGSRLGWKMLIAAPHVAREMMQAMVAADPANGNALMFRGKSWYYTSGPMIGRPYPAQRTINAILGDADLMAWNQTVQAHVDLIRRQFQDAVGLLDSEIIEIPFLLIEDEPGVGSAYQPGTVNLLSYGTTAVIAKPHGAVINGVDPWETDMTARLLPLGINARFAEQWDQLHAALGEVHCGTNPLRSYSAAPAWWGGSR